MSGCCWKEFDKSKLSRCEDNLSIELKEVSQKCIRCNLCIIECEFLKRYGKPGDIADKYISADKPDLSIAFKCSLCRLCSAVCPAEIDPSKMFLEMRRNATARGEGVDRECNGVLAYERRGVSKRYSWHGLPEGCDTIFFPGCTLSGTRPSSTMALFKHLRQSIPSLGIVMDCCTNISHDLGRQEFFLSKFHEMRRFLVQEGVRNVIVACPSCYKIFSQYGEDLNICSVYELLSEVNMEKSIDNQSAVVIHDPCALRFNKSSQDAVRKLANRVGFEVSVMPHSGSKTLCCGEGGSVRHSSNDLSNKWVIERGSETGDKMIVTYCAGCTNQLGKSMSAIHILDIIFDTKAALSGKAKISKPPITYWNRIWLKRQFKKIIKNTAKFSR